MNGTLSSCNFNHVLARNGESIDAITVKFTRFLFSYH